MDHEWFTEQLDPAEVGWDWFSIQLENNTELMLFDLRRKDGTIDPHSSGTYIDAIGEGQCPPFDEAADFSLKPRSYWKKYPVTWRIDVPTLQYRPRLQGHSRQPGSGHVLGRRGDVFRIEPRCGLSRNDRLREANQLSLGFGNRLLTRAALNARSRVVDYLRHNEQSRYNAERLLSRARVSKRLPKSPTTLPERRCW